MNKNSFIAFKNYTLENFNNIVTEVLYCKFNHIDLFLYDTEGRAYNKEIEEESLRTGRPLLELFKEKTDMFCINSFLKTNDLMLFLKNKFKIEMELMENLLDNGRDIMILNDLHKVNKITKHSLNVNKYGFGDTNTLPVFIFSKRKQDDFVQASAKLDISYKRINSYNELTDDMLDLFKKNIINEFSNSVAAEDIYDPLYEQYFIKYGKFVGCENIVKYFKDMRKEDISQIELCVNNLNLMLEDILEKLSKNLVTFKYGGGSLTELGSGVIDKLKALKYFTPIMGDFASELISLYTVKCIEKDFKYIEENLGKKINIDDYFEEYNVYLLDSKFQYGKINKLNLSFVNRYWGDNEILMKIKLNNLFINMENEEHLVTLKQQLFVLSDIFKNYSSNHKQLLNEIDKVEEGLLKIIPTFQSVEEMMKILFYDEDDNLILSDVNLYKRLYKQYYDYLASLENKSILELVMNRSPFINREFNISDINIVYSDLHKNDMNTWDVRDKLEILKKAKFSDLGVELYLYKRADSSDSLVVSINRGVIALDVNNHEILSNFYKNIISYIWENNIVEKEIYENIRHCILSAQISTVKSEWRAFILNDKLQKTEIVQTKKIKKKI